MYIFGHENQNYFSCIQHLTRDFRRTFKFDQVWLINRAKVTQRTDPQHWILAQDMSEVNSEDELDRFPSKKKKRGLYKAYKYDSTKKIPRQTLYSRKNKVQEHQDSRDDSLQPAEAAAYEESTTQHSPIQCKCSSSICKSKF